MQQEHTIMLVDDDEDYSFVTKKILKKAGVGQNILTASNGLAALQKLQEISARGEKLPAVIFLDLKMPIMNGFEFLEEAIKSTTLDISQMRIFITSSSVLPKDKERANKFPIAGFLSKPLTPQILEEIFS